MYFGSPFGQDMILPALWQGLWQAFAAMGIMTGAFSNGALQDRFGRKIMFLVGGSVSAVGEYSVLSRNENIQDRKLTQMFYIQLPLSLSYRQTPNRLIQDGGFCFLQSSFLELQWES